MRPFTYLRASSALDAVRMASRPPAPANQATAQFLAGGTTLLDLMKLDTLRPDTVIDINDLARDFGQVDAGPGGLRLGALARMSDVAALPAIRSGYPVLAQALDLAASQQIRNMATLGGNVLQRTRCEYFRDPSWRQCNKRDPGSGCAALSGVNRMHAVLGVSDRCIASYPGDFGQALTALEAEVEIVGAGGARSMPFEALHVGPGETPETETVLAPGDLITGFHVPARPWTQRSLYLKVRDRQSYEFALASAAVALDLDAAGAVRAARIALGGVSARPWRAREAEAALTGRVLDEGAAWSAAEAAFAASITHGGNDFKPELGRRTLVRALMSAKAMEV